jgi:hypothetical protein
MSVARRVPLLPVLTAALLATTVACNDSADPSEIAAPQLALVPRPLCRLDRPTDPLPIGRQNGRQGTVAQASLGAAATSTVASTDVSRRATIPLCATAAASSGGTARSAAAR